VREAVEALGFKPGDLNLVAIAKGAGSQCRARAVLPGRDAPHSSCRRTTLPSDYLQRLRDEAHRWAIGRRAGQNVWPRSRGRSGLDEITGVGVRRKKRRCCIALVSAKGVSNATVADLQTVEGVNAALAQREVLRSLPWWMIALRAWSTQRRWCWRPRDPDWARMAEAEAARLKTALGDVLVAVHHMGSTAIPGIAGQADRGPDACCYGVGSSRSETFSDRSAGLSMARRAFRSRGAIACWSGTANASSTRTSLMGTNGRAAIAVPGTTPRTSRRSAGL